MPEPEDDGVIPAMYEHCRNVYKQMFDESALEAVEGGPVGMEHIRVYEGFLTNLVTQGLQLSPPYYSKVRELLIRMGCIDQIRRGGGNAKSKWKLIREPDEEAFKAADAIARPNQGRVAGVEQQIRDLNKRIVTIEKALGLT